MQSHECNTQLKDASLTPHAGDGGREPEQARLVLGDHLGTRENFTNNSKCLIWQMQLKSDRFVGDTSHGEPPSEDCGRCWWSSTVSGDVRPHRTSLRSRL